MLSKYPVISAALILFSASASADDLFAKSIEIHNDIMASMNSTHKENFSPGYQGFYYDDCQEATSRPFGDNGLTSGYGSTDCYVKEFDGGNVKSYFKSSPNGSYSSGFSWTFE